jgi:hypothetical protein
MINRSVQKTRHMPKRPTASRITFRASHFVLVDFHFVQSHSQTPSPIRAVPAAAHPFLKSGIQKFTAASPQAPMMRTRYAMMRMPEPA